MAIQHVIFANVSTLSVAGTLVEAANAFQASRNADTKPINAFNNTLPVLIVSTKGLGQGSFTYTVSDGTGSTIQDWSTVITGAVVIACSGATYPTGGSVQSVLCSGCSFGGQSTAMNAQNEMVASVNFSFTSGTI